jgi:hypothetical protein
MPTSSLPFGVNQSLSLTICADADDAKEKGFNYAAAPKGEYLPVRIDHVVVVREGTEMKNPTVDFILVDPSGQKYVVMVTGNLLKSIPC